MADLIDQLFAGLPEPFLADRSLLESYADCPQQGAAVETGLCTTGGPEADSGNEAHEAYGAIVEAFVGGEHRVRDLADIGLGMARRSRPDVQPDVLQAVGRSLWIFASQLVYAPGEQAVLRNPADVLRYQGGKGERSGQLAVDFIPSDYEKPGVRVTSEIDLLMAGPAENVLAETDWKTGHTQWSATDVRAAFQFRLHAWLVMKNYPACEALLCRVWMTRLGYPTDWVRFSRRDAEDMEARLMMTCLNRGMALEAVAAGRPAACWPAKVKCLRCAYCLQCPQAHQDAARLMDDPEAFLADTACVQANLEQRTELLKAYVEAHGELRGGGLVCGEKPAAKKKACITLYEDKGNGD